MYFDEELTCRILAGIRPPERQETKFILGKAREAKGLGFNEAAKLLALDCDDDLAELTESAGKVKQSIYGKRIVLFAPLYLSNHCVNNCLYCGFRKGNLKTPRKRLSHEEVLDEARALSAQGHKRILLVCGEEQRREGLSRLCDIIRAIYKTCDIRRINVNIAPLAEGEFEILKDAGIGTYQMFQETYHRASYNYYHPAGPKADYHWRISSFDRAMRAGINDVGLGVLFGLYDYRYEVLALLQHAAYLEANFGAGPHTVSVPRIQPAEGAAVQEYPWRLSDKEFKKVIAVLRLALPYTGIILTTRESVELRNELLHIGVSQISAGTAHPRADMLYRKMLDIMRRPVRSPAWRLAWRRALMGLSSQWRTTGALMRWSGASVRPVTCRAFTLPAAG